jgi:hypothetical protein
MDDEDFQNDLERARRKRSRADLQKIIGLVLDSPLNEGDMEEIRGDISVQTLATMNTDLKSRIILRMALGAANGDLKSAEFLMKYGGYTPPTESEVTMDVPRIIDDIGTGEDEVYNAESDDEPDAMEGIPIYDDGNC